MTGLSIPHYKRPLGNAQDAAECNESSYAKTLHASEIKATVRGRLSPFLGSRQD